MFGVTHSAIAQLTDIDLSHDEQLADLGSSVDINWNLAGGAHRRWDARSKNG
jgi:hypothetical protein